MKILFTSPYRVLPANTGGGVRTLNLAKAFAGLGHDISMLCARPREEVQVPAGIDVRYFESSNSRDHFFNLDFKRKFAQCLEDSFDLVIAGFPYQAWMIASVIAKRKIPLIYDAHNVEADRFRKMGRSVVAFLVKMAERKMLNLASKAVTVSQEDRRLMRDMHGADSLVLPNGVDTNHMNPGAADASVLQRNGLKEGDYILYFGSYDYPPNIEAAHFLIDKVWPDVREEIADAELAFVGRSPQSWMKGHDGILVTGAVDSIEEVVKGARVVVVPLFSGGGTRLKVVEALACGKTVLATPFGAMGIVNEDSPALRLAEPDNFSRKLIEILCQPSDDVCGNRQARELAKAFDWQGLVRQIEPEIMSLLSSG